MTFRQPDFLSNSPYYDDFEETKNFLKVLFKPGYAVQARELTQLQTILQSQVAKFADHVFQDGSKILGGEIQIVATPYVRLLNTTYNTAGSSTGNSSDAFIEQIQQNAVENNTSVLLKVYRKVGSVFNELSTIKASYFEPSGYSDNDDYTVLFYNVNSISDTVESGTFTMERDLYIGETALGPFLRVINPSLYTDNVQYNPLEFSGEGYIVAVNSGIFYVDGYFVTAPKQTISLFKKSVTGESETSIQSGVLYPDFANAGVRLFNKPSHRIGYRINREIVTSSDDPTLNDPARGYYNYTAPGADRYKISLVLETIEYRSGILDLDNYVTENFIQLLRTTDGVVDYLKNDTSYAKILDLFAKRTNDESGSYTVKPFIADVKEHLRKDKYVMTLSGTSVTEFFPNQNVNLRVGSYIFAKTTNVSNDSYNPYTSTLNSTQSFTIAKIVDVISNFDPATSQKTVKVVAQLENAIKFSSGVGAAFWYKETPSSTVKTLTTTSIQLQIDSNGTYSLLDLPVGNQNKMTFSMQQGKAYIYGYELETFAPRVVEYDKSGGQEEAKTFNNVNVDFNIGNYVVGTFEPRGTTVNVPELDYEQLPLLNLIDRDTSTFLLFPSGNETVSRNIYAWAPFKGSSEGIQGNVVDVLILDDLQSITNPSTNNAGASFPHESVLFVDVT
jgi:hypothetical protein